MGNTGFERFEQVPEEQQVKAGMTPLTPEEKKSAMLDAKLDPSEFISTSKKFKEEIKKEMGEVGDNGPIKQFSEALKSKAEEMMNTLVEKEALPVYRNNAGAKANKIIIGFNDYDIKSGERAGQHVTNGTITIGGSKNNLVYAFNTDMSVASVKYSHNEGFDDKSKTFVNQKTVWNIEANKGDVPAYLIAVYDAIGLKSPEQEKAAGFVIGGQIASAIRENPANKEVTATKGGEIQYEEDGTTPKTTKDVYVTFRQSEEQDINIISVKNHNYETIEVGITKDEGKLVYGKYLADFNEDKRKYDTTQYVKAPQVGELLNFLANTRGTESALIVGDALKEAGVLDFVRDEQIGKDGGFKDIPQDIAEQLPFNDYEEPTADEIEAGV